MQHIDISLKIYSMKALEEAFSNFNEVVKGNMEKIEEDLFRITFFTEDEECIKEFSNYLIGLSAREA